jgi:hypothetical protein
LHYPELFPGVVKNQVLIFKDQIKEKICFVVVVEYILYLTFFNPREVKCNIRLSLCNIQRLTTQNFLIKVIFKALCRASFRFFLVGFFSKLQQNTWFLFLQSDTHMLVLLTCSSDLKNTKKQHSSKGETGRKYI